MFIGSTYVGYVPIQHTQHAYEYVSRQVGSGEMSYMERAVGIGQCGGYQISLGGIDHNLFGRGAKVVKRGGGEG